MVAGGTWTRQQLFDADVTEDPTCPRCGLANETEFHRYWECICNRDVEDIAVQCTQYLCGPLSQVVTDSEGRRRGGRAESNSPARIGSDRDPALWLRGAPGCHLMTVQVDDPSDPIHQPPRQWALGKQELPLVKELTFYTDASGGPNSRWPKLRRVAWGAVLVNPPTWAPMRL